MCKYQEKAKGSAAIVFLLKGYQNAFSKTAVHYDRV